MSKIYTDLNTVLTPYATAIKKNASDITSLNGSLGELQNGVLTDDIKRALIGVLENVVANNTDAAANFNVLRELFGNPVTITFDGTKYLRTGVILTENTKIEVKTTFNSNDNGQYMGTILLSGGKYKRAHVGVINGYGNNVIAVNSTKNYNEWNVIPFDAAPHIYTFMNGYCGIDGNIQPETSDSNYAFPIGSEFYLFYRNGNGSSYNQVPCKASVYYMKVYESDVLVHDFEPVTVNGVVKLYDSIGQVYCEEVTA